MASQEQKLDYLLKKIGYTASKTGISEDSNLSGTKKAPFAEAIPSPLVVPNTVIWAKSSFIPSEPPTEETEYVGIYTGTNAVRFTSDPTVSGNRAFIGHTSFNDTSSSIYGDWIDPQFGADYSVKIYAGDPTSGGTELPAAGTGSDDTWFFDYSSGVLSFNGSNVPSSVTDSNVYVVGYRYIGIKGVISEGGDATLGNVISGILTADQFSTGLTSERLNITGTAILGPSSITIAPFQDGTVFIEGDLQIKGTPVEVNESNIGFFSGSSVVLTESNIFLASDVLNPQDLEGAGIGVGDSSIRRELFYNATIDAWDSNVSFGIRTAKIKLDTPNKMTQIIIIPIINES